MGILFLNHRAPPLTLLIALDLGMLDDEDDEEDEEEEEDEEVKENASDDLKIKKATTLKVCTDECVCWQFISSL